MFSNKILELKDEQIFTAKMHLPQTNSSFKKKKKKKNEKREKQMHTSKLARNKIKHTKRNPSISSRRKGKRKTQLRRFTIRDQTGRSSHQRSKENENPHAKKARN